MTNYTPAELRAQVAAERAAAPEIVEQKNFSLIAGITCGMLAAAADQLERLARENDFLRAYTGQSAKECIYCGLGAENQAQCKLGFPGCSRGDDQMLCREIGSAMERDQLIEEITELRATLAQLRAPR